MRAGLLGRNVGGKSFVADRRINERGGVGDYTGKSESAGGAALLVRIGLGWVAVALVAGGLRFHLRAAIRFLDFRNQRLAGECGERERTTQRQAKQNSQSTAHRLGLYHVRLSGELEI